MLKSFAFTLAVLLIPNVWASEEMAEGVVRKIYSEPAQVMLKHGQIKNINMPPMTMVFKVAPSVSLDSIQAGDTVLFQAEQKGQDYVVTQMKKK